MSFFSGRHTQGCRRGFTLVEVIVAVFIAALVLGVLLRTVSLQLVSIGSTTERYQALVAAAEILERYLAGNESDQLEGFEHTVDTTVVTADPRVEQVRVIVTGRGGSTASLSAYRLRVRRARRKKKEEPVEAPAGEEAPE